MKSFVIFVITFIAISSFAQKLNIKGLGDWEKTMLKLNTKTTNDSCQENSYIVNKKIKAVEQSTLEPDSTKGFLTIFDSKTTYDSNGLIKSVKLLKMNDKYCYTHQYNYNSDKCLYEIVYSNECGMIEPNGECLSIRGFTIKAKLLTYDANNEFLINEKFTYDANFEEYVYEYNAKNVILKITKYLNHKIQYITTFNYEYFE